MRIRPIQPDELPVFAGAATPSEHVATVHDYVSDLLIKGSMRTEWCYVAESRRRAIGAGLFVDEPFPSTRTQTCDPHNLPIFPIPGSSLCPSGPLLQPQSKLHFCFLTQVSNDLPKREQATA